MQMRPEVQLVSMIKAMTDVVIPAVDAKNELAIQQAQLIVGLLNLMIHQLPVQFRFDRDELQRLVSSAEGLSALRSEDRAIKAATLALEANRASAIAVLDRCTTDPAELIEAVRNMREAVSRLMSAAAGGQDGEALNAVEEAVLSLSKEQLLRDRALLLSQGWEPDPAAIPSIETLLNA